MLRIRNDQVHFFGQLRREAVVQELIRDIEVFAPKLAGVIGAEGCSIAARNALEVAQGHGFVRPSSARLFVELMASLGAEFTSDPQLPWASEILQRTREQPEETRRQRLYRRAVAFMDEVHGENNCNAILALQRMFPNDPSLMPRVPGNVEDRVGHDPDTNWASVESVDEDGAKLDWNDQVMAWGDDRCDGSFTWSIPWEFRVRDGPAKVFAIVEQTATVTRAGRASAEKAGAQVSSDLNDRSVEDPIFE